MVDLRTLQRSMAHTMLGQASDEELLAGIKRVGLGPEDRLSIHRNNYRESLSDALLGLFPLCQAFVGELFLKQALRHFVTKYPPREAALYGYGKGVADFLQNYPAAEAIPYLADMARLEWHTHELANANELPAFDDLGAARTALEAGVGLRLHENARLLVSSFPVYDLWRAATGQVAPEDIDPAGEGQSVLLVLHEGQVFYQLLGGDVAQLLIGIKCEDPQVVASLAQLEELVDRGAIALDYS